MSTLGAFLVSVAVAVGVAGLAMSLLRRPLDALLAEVSGSAGRARFWSVFSTITILLAALLGMMSSFPLSARAGWQVRSTVPLVLSAVRSSLGFLLFGLCALGAALLFGIGSYERLRRLDASGWGLRPQTPSRT